MDENKEGWSGRRRHVRHEAGWPAECTDASGFAWRAQVRDYSLGGLGLENCPRLDVDQVIEVRLEDIGSFSCRVAWSNGGRCGVQFLSEQDGISNDDAAAVASLLPDPGGLAAGGHSRKCGLEPCR